MAKTFTLASVAKELNLNPKVVRAKARRGAFAAIKAKAPWVFPATKKRSVVAVLRASAA